MRSALITIGLVLLSAAPSAAQTGKLTGIVTDAKSGDPLPGVNIVLEGTRRGAVTDAEGRYFILNASPGTYTVKASIIGFQTVRKQDVVINISRTTSINFQLQEATYEGEEVTVVSKRPAVELDQTATMDVVRPEDIENTPGLNDLGDILGLQTEVSDGHFRGGRSGESLYKLAGMSIVNPLSSGRSFTPMTSAIKEVEVITSGFSAKYGNAMSGVVNISMKEGGNEWTSRGEVQVRLPGYKHWGGSVFSADSADNPYLDRADNLEFWKQPDPDNPRQKRWESAIGRGFGADDVDSTVGPQLVYDLWRQTHQDVGEKYGGKIDRVVDFTAGGPIYDDLSLFAATRINSTQPILPAPETNKDRQVMGNLTYEVGNGKKLQLSGSYANNYRQEFSSSSGGMYRWIYDRVVGANKVEERSMQLGLNWSHVLNDRTYYDLNLGVLGTTMDEGVDVLAPNRFRDDIYERSVWERTYWPDGFRAGQMDDDFFNEASRTYSLTGAVTSQVTSNHLLEFGLQGSLYDIDIKNRLNHSAQTSAQREFYQAQPYEGAAYLQDKMEFEGMIANVGLRVDGYNPNVNYYTNRFSPFEDPDSAGVSDPANAPQKSAPTVVRLQPRLGFSFPVSTSAVFHLNYGSYLQRPDIEQLVGRRIYRDESAGLVVPRRLGSPQLRPEETRSYDVGLVVGLWRDLALDASGYYKDVENLTERVVYMDTGGSIYESFINREYADIRGFNLRLKKTQGFLSGSVRYNYQVVTGKGSSPFDASRIIGEDQEETQLPDPEDIYLDFDRRHNLIVTASLQSPNDWGPDVFGFHPLEKFYVNVLTEARSGRPYTPFKSNEINSARTPWEYNTDLRITRRFSLPGQVHSKLYVEVFNLLNQRIYDYGDVFEDAENRQKWMNDPNSINYYTNDNGYTTKQSIRIYDNAPRSVDIGFVIEL